MNQPQRITRMRGLRRCWVVTVCEGEDVPGDPSREVQYVYSNDGTSLGKIDPHAITLDPPPSNMVVKP